MGKKDKSTSSAKVAAPAVNGKDKKPAPAPTKSVSKDKAPKDANKGSEKKVAPVKKEATKDSKKEKKPKKLPTPPPPPSSSSSSESDSDSSSSDSDDSSSDEDKAPKAKGSAKAATASTPAVAAKAKKGNSSDSDSDSDSGSSSDSDSDSSSSGSSSSSSSSEEKSKAQQVKTAPPAKKIADTKSTPSPAKKAASDSSSSSGSSDSSDSDSSDSSDEDGDGDAQMKDASPPKPTPVANGAVSNLKRKADSTPSTPIKKPRNEETAATANDGCKTVFVGKLSWNVDSDWLKSEFDSCGEVIGARVVMDKETGKSRGFGYVEFATAEGAKTAMGRDGQEIDGRPVRVDFAPERQNGPSGGGNGNSFTPRGGRQNGEAPATKTLFVGNLPFTLTQDQLWEGFADFGPITRANVATDRESGESKGFGHVEFVNLEDAQKAYAGAGGVQFEGKTPRVDYAQPREPRGSGDAGGGRGRDSGWGGRGGRGGGRGGGFGGRGGGRGAPRGGRGGARTGAIAPAAGTKVKF